MTQGPWSCIRYISISCMANPWLLWGVPMSLYIMNSMKLVTLTFYFRKKIILWYFVMLAGSAFCQKCLERLTGPIIFGKMHLKLISCRYWVFPEIKCNRMTSFMEFMIYRDIRQRMAHPITNKSPAFANAAYAKWIKYTSNWPWSLSQCFPGFKKKLVILVIFFLKFHKFAQTYSIVWFSKKITLPIRAKRLKCNQQINNNW